MCALYWKESLGLIEEGVPSPDKLAAMNENDVFGWLIE